MVKNNSNNNNRGLKRVNLTSDNTAIMFTGYYSDGKHVINRAFEECTNYKSIYGTNIPTKILCKQIGLYIQAHTLYSSVRPIGGVFIIGGYDEYSEYSLYMVEPNGAYKGYKACCFGQDQKIAKNELEKIDFENISTVQATRIIKAVNESANSNNKDKEYELEVGVVSNESNRSYKRVPSQFVDSTISSVKEELEREEDEMEE